MLRVLLLAMLSIPLLADPAESALTTERVASGLTRPVYVTAPDGDLDRLFIVEKLGRIKILKGGSVLTRPFLDIQTLVDETFNEQGLLGLAFDPDYDTNGYFYVYFIYDPPGAGLDRSRIMRFTASSDPDSADAASGHEVFRKPQDDWNHNGGQIDFGPDGYLYIGLGDGGGGGDQPNNAQNGQEYLGKMLRIDPHGDDFPGDANNNYAIPPTNPFVGNAGFLDEIWAYGLRNPYRWSFDRLTGDMYIGDVGQQTWEEVSFQPAASTGGENYGWRCWEGTHSYNQNPPCSPTVVWPIREYSHSQDGFSCSITGGYVYRGADIPSLQGTYFYADYCSNQIYSFDYTSGSLTNLTNRTAELDPPGAPSIAAISGFGEDAAGELYIVELNGEVFKILQDPTDVPSVERPTKFGLRSTGPNPFRDATDLTLAIERPGHVDVAVYDSSGRLMRRLLSGSHSAGLVPVHWDGTNAELQSVPSGVYFVRAASGDRSSTVRVTRLR
ncbi:MAG: hypothetical protein DHS20C21_15050 [Gemmatimonadota bacterium]|nr:MAG: hypothetical protein DHS20C21_15050 [Gemmatimonadota bacterium]